ncbi:UNVERIFIED_CONTAM: hypothetical protein Scaly_1046400 [Sesamum calycinum]|uniref:RNase H type-1 domain-containing protein n=1 Tax=Sesamum calycinum TaxID=2727403 RepID=A0AAW2QL95_9LAMI
MSAQALLRAGCRWRVESGANIHIWTDPWLPHPLTFRPITPPSADSLHMCVAELLDSSTEAWNKGGTVFTPASCWKLNMVGGGNCGRRESRINSRSSFGKLVRMLPTNVNLARRRPNFPTVFPFCRSEGEDVVDTMISYPFAWKVWGLVLFPSSSIPRVPLDFFGWIRLVASSLSTSDLGLFLGLCWTIWWCRNQKLFKGKCLAPDQAVCFARHYIDSYLLQNLDAPCSTPSRSVLHWQRPPQGMVKLNFDGALMDQGGAMGMDIIAQDHMGACIDWIFVCLPSHSHAELAEALAAREAILLAHRGGWSKIILDRDYATLIRKLVSRFVTCRRFGSSQENTLLPTLVTSLVSVDISS